MPDKLLLTPEEMRGEIQNKLAVGFISESVIDEFIKENAQLLYGLLESQLAKAKPTIEKQGFAKGIGHYRKVILPAMIEEARQEERAEVGEYLEHCHLSPYETHRLISIHDIERLKSGQSLKEGA